MNAGETLVPPVTLNNGVRIPQLGLGTARLDNEETRRIVREALGLGYRLIDTAASYGNEAGVGRGIVDSGLDRGEVFVTTKLRGAEQGYESTLKALDTSLDRLALSYVDLYLIHWPLPRVDAFVQSWAAMEELVAVGKTRAIGVSNFLPEYLDRLAATSTTVPAVNQIELHPRLPQVELRRENARRGIATESWSPLANGGDVLTSPVTAEIGAGYRRSPAQVVLRWHAQQGLIAIPKASSADRLRENLTVFDFDLTAKDMLAIDALAVGGPAVGTEDPRTHEEF